jgi:hypothetical protein
VGETTLSDHKDVAWYISREGQRFGPFTADDFADFEATNQIKASDHIWYTGLDDWLAYSEYTRAEQTSKLIGVQPGGIGSPSKRLIGAQLIARKLLRVPRGIAATTFQVLTTPTVFAKQQIDTGPRALHRALYFYFSLFTLAFLIMSSVSHLYFYTGVSQPRELGILVVQIAMGVPIIYLCNRALRQPVRFTGVAQGVLYPDGIFIVLLAAIGAGLAYVAFRHADSSGEIDVIPTEVERCLTGYSYVYWILRGDIQLLSHAPTDPSMLAFAREYFCYPLAVPFCVIFAKMMRARYGASFWLNAVASILTYPLVLYASTYAKDHVESAIAAAAPCHELGAQHAFSTYNHSLVTRQIGERANLQMNFAFRTADRKWITVKDDVLLLDLVMRPLNDPAKGREELSQISNGSRSFYCESNTAFRYARAIGIPLVLTLRDAFGTVVLREEITPATCAAKR